MYAKWNPSSALKGLRTDMALAKMYTNMDNPSVKALMKLIETRSAATVYTWLGGLLDLYYIPVLNRYDIHEADGLGGLLAHYDKKDKDRMKGCIAKLRTMAKDKTFTPEVTASLRAASTGAAVITTASNSLGCVLYGCAAFAYDKAGKDVAKEEFLRLCEEHLDDVLERLEAIEETDGQNPIKVSWGC